MPKGSNFGGKVRLGMVYGPGFLPDSLIFEPRASAIGSIIPPFDLNLVGIMHTKFNLALTLALSVADSACTNRGSGRSIGVRSKGV